MELWKTCRAINNEIRLAMLREIARSPNRELNVLQAGDFVGAARRGRVPDSRAHGKVRGLLRQAAGRHGVPLVRVLLDLAQDEDGI